MKFIKIIFIVPVAYLTACQPRNESREHMDITSNRMSDSILNLLDSSLTQPLKILGGRDSPIASVASSFTPANQAK